MSQTSFNYIFINSLIIHSLNSYKKLLKRPKDLLINASHVLRQSILADVIPNNCLGNKSNVFYYNNKNNQLKKQVWPLWRCFLDAQLWTWAYHLSSRVVAVTTTTEILYKLSRESHNRFITKLFSRVLLRAKRTLEDIF